MGRTKNQTSSPTGWLRMHVWRMCLRRRKSAIISWDGSFVILGVSDIFQPSHEIMVLFVFHKLILQMRMPSHPVGLDVWFLVRPFVYFHGSCVRTAKALARLRRCTGSPQPLLVTYVVSTIISWAGSDIFNTKKHISFSNYIETFNSWSANIAYSFYIHTIGKEFKHSNPKDLLLYVLHVKFKVMDKYVLKQIKAATWQNQLNECAPSKDRSAWASAQSDQSLRCPHEETFGP